MPTENEIRVIKLLTAIEIPGNAGQLVEQWGNEAVTVVCEAAAGSYPGLREKVRTNAVALLGYMDHPQALETIALLVGNPDPDIAIRAMRAAGRQKNTDVVGQLGEVIDREDSTDLVAAEALKALAAIATSEAQAKVASYSAAIDGAPNHRRSDVVRSVLERLGQH